MTNAAIAIKSKAPPTAMPAIAPVDSKAWLLAAGVFEGVLDGGAGSMGSAPMARKVVREVVLELKTAGARLDDGHDPCAHGLVLQQPRKGGTFFWHVYHSVDELDPLHCCAGISW